MKERVGHGGKIITRIRVRNETAFSKEHEMQEHCRHLDDVFEKIHYHELDARDKVAQRLQMPLIAFLALSGFVGHLLQNVIWEIESPWADWFWLLLVCAIIALSGAMIFFVRSTIGKTYNYLPVPASWKDYQTECIELYKDFTNSGALVSAALQKNLIETYIECATINGAINARKFSDVFWLLRCLIVSSLFTFVAFGVFFVGGLDKNRIKSPYRVEVVNPVVFQGEEMPSTKPPPPPPKPPVRQIKEDRSTPTQPKAPPARPVPNNG